MAWRIHDHVLRGELDNREKGVVRGRIWLHGVDVPVEIELQGNAHTDLAGCLLTFRNTSETFPIQIEDGFKLEQKGRAGDLTASRKVRVLDDLPDDDAELDFEDTEVQPGHMANCLYLEWFSEGNGRVVIESTDFELEVSPPLWRLSPEEEADRAARAEANFTEFLSKLNDAVEAARHDPPEDKEWDEFDYELMMRESDARTEKYIELIEKYGDGPDADEIINREMGWDFDSDDFGDDDDDEISNEEAGEYEALTPEPLTEGVDWIRTKDGDIRHPLQHTCHEAAMRFRNEWSQLDAARKDNHELCDLMAEFQITAGKLAGALNSLAYGRDFQEGPFIVACLKRALGHLHKTLSALESVTPRDLLPQGVIDRTRSDLFSIREGILTLMDEFRGRKK